MHRSRLLDARVLGSAALFVALVLALLISARVTASPGSSDPTSSPAPARPTATVPVGANPVTTPSSPLQVPVHPPVSFAGAVAYGRAHDVRIAVAARDLDSGRTWSAGDPGLFGTGSVVKVMVAAKMALSGALTGSDEREAYEMIVGSNDDDCSDLWERNGGPTIIDWLEKHYRIEIGAPNLRFGFWGNTRITARGMAALYGALAADESVWPWLRDAMAHTQRIAADGTDQYFGIPAAGGGHVVKQGWASASSGDGFSKDATVNTTGIVSVDGHRIAVVILTEGDANDGSNDARGYNHAQGAVVTEVARRVLAGLRTGL